MTRGRSSTRRRQRTFQTLFCCLLALVTSFSGTLAFAERVLESNKKMEGRKNSQEIQIAFVGNSMFYFNDCPRLMEQMLIQSKLWDEVHQDSCLRGGASLQSLWQDGNGMQNKFSTPAAVRSAGSKTKKYDIGAPTVKSLLSDMQPHSDNQKCLNVIIMNDQTQSPARPETRKATLRVLRDKYLPLVVKQKSKECRVVILFMQTPAYQVEGIRDTDDLGDFDNFTNLLAQGYETYRQLVLQHDYEEPSMIDDCQVAPVGEAYRYIRNADEALWEKLYYSYDKFHPSAHGTWLQACVLFATLTGRAPPDYQAQWWNVARYMQRPGKDSMPLPTKKEAEQLRQVACRVCNIDPCVATGDTASRL